MHSLGIESGADLRRQTLAFLQQHFGKSGPWYFEIARGHDNRAVRPDRERKSSGSQAFREDLTEPQEIEAGVDLPKCCCRKANVWRRRSAPDSMPRLCILAAVTGPTP